MPSPHPAGRSLPAGDSTAARLTAEKRREQLIQIAVDLFSRKGFSGTTTKEIAAAAGVTEAIIFRHFKTKEELYTAIIDRRMRSPEAEEWIAGLQAAMDRDDDRGVICQVIGAIVTSYKADAKFERLMLYAALEGNKVALTHMCQVTESIVEAYRNYFARRRKQGVFLPNEPDAALVAIVGMAQHHAQNRYVHEMNDYDLSDEQAIECFTNIAANGLLVKPQPSKKNP